MMLYRVVNPEDVDSTYGNCVPVETAQYATRLDLYEHGSENFKISYSFRSINPSSVSMGKM